ncbi:MAG: hypothetical protein WC676_05405 [Candidatus Omnitrophota bacterium]
MTKRSIPFIFVVALLFTGAISFAQQEVTLPPASSVNQPVPEGMEAVQIGASAVLIIPKGAKTRKVGAQIIVEGTKEYMARKTFEIEERLLEIEKRQSDMAKDIESLKNAREIK